ncbi:MAG: gliding motility-associated C-terminal domain-containing protein, partial [Flavobacteriales bacterium]|nr:gliding motility-associated C-terminal domain-containing protein [Flavobacteriales bacterium]
LTLTASGADTYVWDGGVTDGVAFTPALGTTTYTVTGTDVNGCTSTDDVIVSVTIFPPVDAGVDQEVCEGETVTLTGSGAGAGGTYIWDGGVTDGIAFTPGLGTTTYIVTGTMVSGCESTDTVDITVNPLPTVTATADETEVCEGTTVTLTGSGAGAAGTYTWDGGVTDGVAFTPDPGTISYTVTGTDINGCENTATVDVTVNPLPTVTATADETEICIGATVILTGSGVGAGGAYTWDGGVIDGVAFTPGVGTTTYTVTGTDANGCENTATVDLIVYDVPEVFAGTNDTICDATEAYVLNGNEPFIGTGMWTITSGSGVLTDELSHNSSVELSYGVNVFVWTITNGACVASDEVLVYYNTDLCAINAPTGFSPNGDGVNDLFIIEGLNSFDKVSLVVFNRWGSKVYESNDYQNDWDGTNQFGISLGNNPLPSGTYFYIIKAGDSTDPIKNYLQIER